MLKGKIIDIDKNGFAIIQAEIPINQIIHREVKEVYVQPIDSRNLSDKQRRMCYALLNAIAEWSGNTQQEIKDIFKLEFMADKIDYLGDKIFSLSNAPMSLIAEFQRFIIDFIISNGIPTKKPLLEYVDDIDSYVYSCVINKKCVICGRRADLHHMDGSTVGMGNDRNEVIHLGREVMSVCRNHHSEYHTIGHKEFMSKYHLNKGVIVDKTILKIYGLKK